MATLLPSADEQDWLLAALADLVARRGSRPFLEAPLLFPDTRSFPDPYTPDEHGVATIARRLLAYADLHALEADVEVFADDDEEVQLDGTGRARGHRHEGAAAWFAGIERGRCRFGVDVRGLSDPDLLVGTMCHEVAHAFRAVHGLVLADDAEEEQLTDVTTIYLGFGVLTTNAAYRYRSSGGIDGVFAVTEWTHAQAGYLGAVAMSFLLAAQAVARGLDGAALRRVRGELETNQAGYFRAACRVLERERGLASKLGLPGIERSRRLPEPEPVPLAPVARIVRATSEGPAPTHAVRGHGPNAGRPTFRVRRTKVVPYGLVGLLAGGIGAAGAVHVGLGEAAAVAVGTAGALAGILVGRRTRWDYCSDPGCEGELPVDVRTCPRCGGTLSGTLGSPDERLDAEERLATGSRTSEE